MKNEKIIFFIDSLGAGGAQKQIVTLAREFKLNGHEVAVIIYHNNYQLEDLLRDVSIPVFYVEKKMKLDFTFLYRFIYCVKRFEPDVIISYLNTPNMWVRMASLFLKDVKIITSERNIDLPSSQARVLIEKLLNKLSYKIVANAESIKNILCTDIGVETNKVEVIYNGLDTDYYRCDLNYDYSGLRKELNAVDKTILLLPGRIEKQKNHICLIEAVSKLDRGLINRLKVLFVGNIFDAKLHKDLLNVISSYGLEDVFGFLGVRNDMKKLYNVSDIVVLPSLWEGMPNVVLEAMSCSKVVIASNVSDNPLFIRSSINGYLFENDDADDLSDKLKQAIGLDDLTKKTIAINARNDIVNMCSLDKFYKNYINLVRS